MRILAIASTVSSITCWSQPHAAEATNQHLYQSLMPLDVIQRLLVASMHAHAVRVRRFLLCFSVWKSITAILLTTSKSVHTKKHHIRNQ